MATTETKPVKTETAPEDIPAEAGEEASGDVARGNGQAGSKSETRKQHGKGFIYMGLKDCDDALRKIDAHEKKMSIENFARALGHNAPKGRFLQKLDALKSFGLVEVSEEYVHLTPLAIDMLYGAGDSAKLKGRTMAFLSYPDFKKVFVEFPKGQDNQRTHVIDFVKAKLGIVNDVDRFFKLFVESAHFAGLIEGSANPESKVIRLLGAPLPTGAAGDTNAAAAPAAEEYSVLAPDEVDDYLEAVGLSDYKQRSEVRQRTTGTFKLTVGDGKITLEIDRPVRIVIKPDNVLAELQQIVTAMQQKGLKA